MDVLICKKKDANGELNIAKNVVLVPCVFDSILTASLGPISLGEKG